MQSKRHSHAEALTNVVVGAFASVLVTMLWFGVGALEASAVMLVYAAISYVRSYAIRRVFNWLPSKWDMCHRVPRASAETPAMLTFKRWTARLLSAFRWIVAALTKSSGKPAS